MIWLKTILSVAFLAILSTCGPKFDKPETEEQRQCRSFVQQFYDWYVPKALNAEGVPASLRVLEQKKHLFSSELINRLYEDAKIRADAPSMIAGLDFDPFLSAQDPFPKYIVGEVTKNQNKCFAKIYGISNSTHKSDIPDVIVELRVNDGEWAFQNFYYGGEIGSTSKNLLAILQTIITNHRKQQSVPLKRTGMGATPTIKGR
jgi:hypothetical protein